MLYKGLETIYSNPEKVAGRFVRADGYRTHYFEAGDPAAEPLVLVHGGSQIGLGADRFYPNIIPLAERFHVFAVDEVGFGESDEPRNLIDLRHTRKRADHLIALIEELGIGPVHLVGQSEGGWIVTYISLTRPDLVRRLVLVDSGSTAGGGGWKNGEVRHIPYFDKVFVPGTMTPLHEFKTRADILEHERAFVYNDDPFTEDYVTRLEQLAGKWNDRFMAQSREFWKDSVAGWKAQWEIFSYNGTHIRESLKDLRVPTLVVWAMHSNKGVENGIEMFKRIPDAQLHLIDRANHFLWLDRPHEFNTLVTWYLTDGLRTFSGE